VTECLIYKKIEHKLKQITDWFILHKHKVTEDPNTKITDVVT